MMHGTVLSLALLLATAASTVDAGTSKTNAPSDLVTRPGNPSTTPDPTPSPTSSIDDVISSSPTPPPTLLDTSSPTPPLTSPDTDTGNEMGHTNTACTREECEGRAIEMDKTFYNGIFPSKGCYSKNQNAFFSPGTQEEMETEEMPGIQERIWC
mmetsp:Transcript_1468/g.2508  ORF Transcript_1468/g.2508 Transcript_1468/m.2508 type:complete len:154 (-) Transcript_1468:368-829(-)